MKGLDPRFVQQVLNPTENAPLPIEVLDPNTGVTDDISNQINAGGDTINTGGGNTGGSVTTLQDLLNALNGQDNSNLTNSMSTDLDSSSSDTDSSSANTGSTASLMDFLAELSGT